MELADLRWDERGLLPVVIQDAASGTVLTLAHANLIALEETLRTKQTVLFSRSRNSLWRKGETSGNTQAVQSVSYDCDADALLYQVIPQGPACHTGKPSCFHNTLHGTHRQSNDFALALLMLQDVLSGRKAQAPPDSYVGKLFRGGPDAICKKIGEEAAEVIIAAKNSEESERVWEASDLLFHLLVLLELQDIPLERIGAELLRRHHEGS
ncbi:MAG: bifunctional phosphoribosyl-AMP cyclohydrolase/phosphoribosyl-ATP diphosphatase HisIE [Candidatus Eremiobacteraeota bacterium]|nr:bifunctional phosphoribosyl-AMP cyclohydrolase/phosphoribosyl-ATP diphosphatase HisIE [Candidatus Eremiobacteraeota bacterium]